MNGIPNYLADLNLSEQQVVLVAGLIDRPKIVKLGVESFSFWEEKDYELDEFRKILTAEQFRLYGDIHRQEIERHEQWLREWDAGRVKELALQEEYTAWLRDSFVPGLRREALNVQRVSFTEQDKVDFLKQAYRRYVDAQHQRVLVRHYRQSRGFQPNGLQIALLQNEHPRLLPAYGSFVNAADAAEKAMAAFVLDFCRPLATMKGGFLRELGPRVKEKYEELRLKHIGKEEIRGWHTTIYPKTNLSIEEGWVMSLLLMDDGMRSGGWGAGAGGR